MLHFRLFRIKVYLSPQRNPFYSDKADGGRYHFASQAGRVFFNQYVKDSKTE